MTKQEIRKLFQNRRNQLTALELDTLSIKIAQQFIAFTDVNAKRISVFQSIVTKREVDTSHLMKLIERNNGFIAIPKWNIQTNEIIHYSSESITRYEKNSFGIIEPQEGDQLTNEQIDIICIPLLAVDKRGFRVGYGKGVYDQFLSTSSAIKVGLSIFDEISTISDKHDFDIQLDYCIFPNSISTYEKAAR